MTTFTTTGSLPLFTGRNETEQRAANNGSGSNLIFCHAYRRTFRRRRFSYGDQSEEKTTVSLGVVSNRSFLSLAALRWTLHRNQIGVYQEREKGIGGKLKESAAKKNLFTINLNQCLLQSLQSWIAMFTIIIYFLASRSHAFLINSWKSNKTGYHVIAAPLEISLKDDATGGGQGWHRTKRKAFRRKVVQVGDTISLSTSVLSLPIY